jgi:enoyl-CoA hydratase
MSGLSVRREGDLLHLQLNQPHRANALSEDVVEDMLAALAGDATIGVRLAIFSGCGPSFCAGFDLSGLQHTTDAQLLWRMVRLELLLQEIFYAPFLTLAFAQGNAIGAGADLFCACSMRVAAPDTIFRMPGWKFGVALGTRRLAARVGDETARELLIESKSFGSVRGQEIRFVQEVAPEADWEKLTAAAARKASTLRESSVNHLLQLTGRDTRDADLAALVRSASQPGLRDRISEFVGMAATGKGR